MKSPETKLRIKRISTSPYFNPQFLQNERKALEVFGEVYDLGNQEALPNVIITNTHTRFNKFDAHLCDQLNLIIHPNSGYDNITLDFLSKINAPVVVGNTLRLKSQG